MKNYHHIKIVLVSSVNFAEWNEILIGYYYLNYMDIFVPSAEVFTVGPGASAGAASLG